MPIKFPRVPDAMPEKPRVACKADPEVMFPLVGNQGGVDAAKEVCAECPVLKQCREMAIQLVKTGAVQHGVIAGVHVEGRRRRLVLRELVQAAAADRQLLEVA